MTRKRSLASVVAIVAALLAAVTVMGFVYGEYQKDTFTYVFYNDTAPDNHPNHNSGDVLDASFASDILAAAPADVRANPAANAEWFKKDLFNRLYDQEANSGDPALLAQLSLDAMLRAPKTVGEKLLPYDRQSIEMWRETVLGFVDNEGSHISTAGKLQAVLNRGTVTVREITGGYVSMGYMKRDGITLEAGHADKLGRNAVPRPVIENSNGTKGYEIVFTFPNGEVLSYRINCGYQPDGTNYPPGGSTPTYKPPEIDINIDDPKPPTPKPPTPKPPTTTTPKPKDPNAGPQGQVPNHPDFGGGPNTNNDTRLTDEPKSPSTYKPPAKPTPPANDDRFDTDADRGNGIVDQYQPDSNGNGKNETIGVDTDGDGRNDSSFTGEVVVGTPPGQSLDDVHESPPPVEGGLNDGQNQGSVGPPN
jgi:hypothetical protein